MIAEGQLQFRFWSSYNKYRLLGVVTIDRGHFFQHHYNIPGHTAGQTLITDWCMIPFPRNDMDLIAVRAGCTFTGKNLR